MMHERFPVENIWIVNARDRSITKSCTIRCTGFLQKEDTQTFSV